MGTYGVLVNNAIMVSFLGACTASAPAPQDQLSEVFRVVAAFRRSHRPRPQLYSRLLTLCAKSGMHERAQAVWAAMQQVRVDVCTASGMLMCYHVRLTVQHPGSGPGLPSIE